MPNPIRHLPSLDGDQKPAPERLSPPVRERDAESQPAIGTHIVEKDKASAAAQPLSVVLAEVAERVCAATRASGAIIAFVEPDLVCRASTGVAPAIGSRLESSSGLTKECLLTAQVVLCEDAQHDSRVQPSLARSLHLGSAALAPIIAQGVVLGVVEVFSSKSAWFGSAQIVELMSTAPWLPSVVATVSHTTPPVSHATPAISHTIQSGERWSRPWLVPAAAALLISAFVLFQLTASRKSATRPSSITPTEAGRTENLPAIVESGKTPPPSTLIPAEPTDSMGAGNKTGPLSHEAQATYSISLYSEEAPLSDARSHASGSRVANLTAAIQSLPAESDISAGPIPPASILAGERTEKPAPAILSMMSPAPTLPVLARGAAPAPIAKLNHSAGLDFVLDRTLKGHSSWVTGVAFSSDGLRLASGSWDQSVKLWDVQTGQQLSTVSRGPKEVQALAFSRDGRLLATENSSDAVTLWDGASGHEIRTLHSNKALDVLGASWVYSIAFSPDGRWLASAIDDKTIRVWDVQTGAAVRDLPGPRRSVAYAAFSPDGRWLASGADDHTIRICDASTGEEIRALRGHDKTVYAVAFSPDGHWLASASADKSVKVWDVESGREVHTLTGHKGAVTSLSFSPDGRWLASGSWDRTVKILDMESGREVQTLAGYDHSVYTVAFDSAGQRLASGSEDGTIKLWRVNANTDSSRLP